MTHRSDDAGDTLVTVEQRSLNRSDWSDLLPAAADGSRPVDRSRVRTGRSDGAPAPSLSPPTGRTP